MKYAQTVSCKRNRLKALIQFYHSLNQTGGLGDVWVDIIKTDYTCAMLHMLL